MNNALKAMLDSNLKSMKLATMLKHLEEKLRQAKEGKLPYEEFLLNLTEIEVQVRKENGCQRRINESNFPLAELGYVPFSKEEDSVQGSSNCIRSKLFQQYLFTNLVSQII